MENSFLCLVINHPSKDYSILSGPSHTWAPLFSQRRGGGIFRVYMGQKVLNIFAPNCYMEIAFFAEIVRYRMGQPLI